jgi:hypothetical protein
MVLVIYHIRLLATANRRRVKCVNGSDSGRRVLGNVAGCTHTQPPRASRAGNTKTSLRFSM